MKKDKEFKQNTHLRYSNRVARILFLIISVFLLILSIFIVVSRNQVVHPTSESNISMTPSATPIYLDTPPAQAEFYDTFKNNAQSWNVSSAFGYVRTITRDGLILTNTHRNSTLIESLPTNSLFANCTVIVDLTMLDVGSNDSIGIFFRGDTNLEHDYRIDLFGDGSFDIVKESLDSENNPQNVVLVKAKIDTILKPKGDKNLILLTMNGPQMRLYINNMKISSITDSDYTSGQVALFAQMNGNSPKVSALFSKVEVDNISGTLNVG
jgi:hypothetical protein